MALRIKNKSLISESIITQLGNLIVPENTIINVPSYFTEKQVSEAIAPFPNLALLGGYVLNSDDIVDGNLLSHAGVMTKDVYDTNYNNIVDDAEHSESGGSSSSLEVLFNFNDFATGFKNIGNILANRTVESVSVIITSAFDTGSVSVGDDSDNLRLADITNSDITYVGTYDNINNYTYVADTLVKLFMNGSPTTGSGKIIVFIG